MITSHTIIFLMLISIGFVLISGIAMMAIGGKLNQKYGNRLMVLRVALQGIVVLMLGAMFLFGR